MIFFFFFFVTGLELCSHGYKEVLNNLRSLRILCADDDIWKGRRADLKFLMGKWLC